MQFSAEPKNCTQHTNNGRRQNKIVVVVVNKREPHIFLQYIFFYNTNVGMNKTYMRYDTISFNRTLREYIEREKKIH